MVLNRGGLGQIGDIVTNLNDALGGREDAVRDLLTRLDTFVGTLDTQRADIVETIDGLNRLAGTVSGQRDVVADVLDRLPAALEVLLQERPAFTTALDRLRTFSDTATAVVTDTRQDLVTNLEHLEPTLRALADVGTDLDKALAYATVYPYGQSVIDRAVRGDYLNLFATVDLTVPPAPARIAARHPWGRSECVVQAAVGDPGYAQPTRDPLGAGWEVPDDPVALRPLPAGRVRGPRARGAARHDVRLHPGPVARRVGRIRVTVDLPPPAVCTGSRT